MKRAVRDFAHWGELAAFLAATAGPVVYVVLIGLLLRMTGT